MIQTHVHILYIHTTYTLNYKQISYSFLYSSDHVILYANVIKLKVIMTINTWIRKIGAKSLGFEALIPAYLKCTLPYWYVLSDIIYKVNYWQNLKDSKSKFSHGMCLTCRYNLLDINIYILRICKIHIYIYIYNLYVYIFDIYTHILNNITY